MAHEWQKHVEEVDKAYWKDSIVTVEKYRDNGIAVELMIVAAENYFWDYDHLDEAVYCQKYYGRIYQQSKFFFFFVKIFALNNQDVARTAALKGYHFAHNMPFEQLIEYDSYKKPHLEDAHDIRSILT